ncbi:MAG: hypothetical protein H0U59_02580 [Gemmatimonadaceae bacterium]|nr:hypothetical protein [Gemmatimonadaceae bacterium]
MSGIRASPVGLQDEDDDYSFYLLKSDVERLAQRLEPVAVEYEAERAFPPTPFGSMAYQDSGAVAITGGTLSSVTVNGLFLDGYVGCGNLSGFYAVAGPVSINMSTGSVSLSSATHSLSVGSEVHITGNLTANDMYKIARFYDVTIDGALRVNATALVPTVFTPNTKIPINISGIIHYLFASTAV